MLKLGFEGLSPKDNNIRWYSQMVRQWIANSRSPSSSLGATYKKIPLVPMQIIKRQCRDIKFRKVKYGSISLSS